MKDSKALRILSWLWHAVKRFFKWYFSLYRRPWYIKTVTIIVSIVVFIIVYFGMVDINFLGLFGRSPGFAEIKNPMTSEASEIYSADSVLIGKFFSENRTPVKYEQVSGSFWQTLIAVEDERFYKHKGVDFVGLVAVLKDAILTREGRGGSTITQQLAKNMFRVRTQYSTGLLGNIPGVRILVMKSKEWIIATKLEMVYEKKDILEMYANTVDFGSNAYGIKTACKTYFGTTPDKLTWDQSAVLVGMLKATTYYNPIINPNNCRERRNVILGMLADKGIISQEECARLRETPIKLDYSVENNYDGQALYFRAAIASRLAEWCREKGYDLYSSGLKIYTTLDTRMQAMAEEAVIRQMRQVQRNFNNHWGKEEPWQDERHHVIDGFIEGIAQKLPVYKQLTKRFPNSPDSVEYYLNKPHKVKLFSYDDGGSMEAEMSTMDSIRFMVRFMHCAFVAMEPQTGHVKAWVGDIDFDTWKYDKVTAMRQPGSTFKLFVYTEAMNRGITPCDERRDEYISMEVYDKNKGEMTRWTPTNADGHFTGDTIPLKAAFARSINSIAVRLGQEVGIANIASVAHEMGIKSPLDETPSLALGSSDVTLLEMVNAYGCVANDGKHVDPVLITKIVDRDGRTVYAEPSNEKRVLPNRSAFLMQQMLMAGMREPGGTSMSLWGYVGNFRDTDFGGKTGTSNNHSDAWFIAVTPNIVCGAWVGGEYRCIHFRTGALGQGSRTALPVCGNFLEALLNDSRYAKYHGKFPKPTDKSVTYDMYNCPSYYGHKPDTLAADSIAAADSLSLGNGETLPNLDGITPPSDKILPPKPQEQEVTFGNL